MHCVNPLTTAHNIVLLVRIFFHNLKALSSASSLFVNFFDQMVQKSQALRRFERVSVFAPRREWDAEKAGMAVSRWCWAAL